MWAGTIKLNISYVHLVQNFTAPTLSWKFRKMGELEEGETKRLKSQQALAREVEKNMGLSTNVHVQ